MPTIGCYALCAIEKCNDSSEIELNSRESFLRNFTYWHPFEYAAYHRRIPWYVMSTIIQPHFTFISLNGSNHNLTFLLKFIVVIIDDLLLGDLRYKITVYKICIYKFPNK